MAINSHPCDECRYYDIIKPGKPAGGRHGWCAAKSVYPWKEPEGQIFPNGVRRARSGDPSQPVIVRGDETVDNCTLYRTKGD